jgi:hypothetical protein
MNLFWKISKHFGRQDAKNCRRLIARCILTIVSLYQATRADAETDLQRALRRAQFLFIQTTPTEEHYGADAASEESYRAAVRSYLDHPNFYDAVLRFHERRFGTGLRTEYLDELQNEDIDNKAKKLAQISCNRTTGTDKKLRCFWFEKSGRQQSADCPASAEYPVSVFWYPSVVAWVCPSIARACGANLSQCFVKHKNEGEADSTELGATEFFDSKVSIVKSLSRQAAGLATAVVVGNYPYTKILEPGLTAVDGAIAHFYRQNFHFDLKKLNTSQELIDVVAGIDLADNRFRLVNLGPSYDQGGILSSFGWLRRYEKNRSRANQLYERLLCRKFTSALPRVFPRDSGNLRETPGCNGCHATLDPLADFFATWGEGGELYAAPKNAVATSFANHDGQYLSDLADIIRNDNAFASCTVEQSWEWLMGRGFFRDEAELRTAFTQYFVTTGYSMKELLYAIATHPAFMDGTRTDALVGDPLSEPPLGEMPGGGEAASCDTTIDYAADIAPHMNVCTSCHGASSSSRQDLTTEASLISWGSQIVSMMASGNMPPGQAGPPLIGPTFELKEKIRCYLEQRQ